MRRSLSCSTLENETSPSQDKHETETSPVYWKNNLQQASSTTALVCFVYTFTLMMRAEEDTQKVQELVGEVSGT